LYPYGEPAHLPIVGLQNPQAGEEVPEGSVVDLYVVTCDWNASGVVDIQDFAALANNWLSEEAVNPVDLNLDNIVDILDVSLFTRYWLAEEMPE